MSTTLLELRLSNGLHQELHCNSNIQTRYLAKTVQQHPLMWAEWKVFQLKLWVFASKSTIIIMDCLIECLHTFDFLSLAKADPETWKIFFVYAENRLTPGKSYMHNMWIIFWFCYYHTDIVKEMLFVRYAIKGNVNHSLEERTYMILLIFWMNVMVSVIMCIFIHAFLL